MTNRKQVVEKVIDKLVGVGPVTEQQGPRMDNRNTKYELEAARDYFSGAVESLTAAMEAIPENDEPLVITPVLKKAVDGTDEAVAETRDLFYELINYMAFASRSR